MIHLKRIKNGTIIVLSLLGLSALILIGIAVTCKYPLVIVALLIYALGYLVTEKK